ncbi:MAG: TIGR03767 family metallophosphoesterase [Acidimicrobiia bacterium]|nr:TIGR03767 family metallophosphoesterase [Acidimicrobiia bacterium]
MPLSRRQFLGVVGVVAAAAAYPTYRLIEDGGLDDDSSVDPAELPTTLLSTIALTGTGAYRALANAAGEPFLVRDDLGTVAGPDRASDRRSILFFGQFTDTHLIDAQSPARLEWTFSPDAGTPSGAIRAQDTLTVAVLDQMVRAMNAVPESPVTGAPMAVGVVTGDNTDGKAGSELRWYIDVLDGKSVTPNTGAKDEYEGVQAWEGTDYAWHPDDPSKDAWGMHGYPSYEGLLQAAVSTEIDSPGLSVPWLAVSGNHDMLWQGNFRRLDVTSDYATGDLKLSKSDAFGGALLLAETPTGEKDVGKAETALAGLTAGEGVEKVTADESRKIYTVEEFVDAHLESPDNPGPVGHGFTDDNKLNGTAYWARDEGPAVRFIGLDTNNHFFGADGSLPGDQYDWLENELQTNSSRYFDSSGNEQTHNAKDRLIVVISHHTSFTMDNTVQDPEKPEQKLYTGKEITDLFLRYPNVIAWVNGHTHTNTILPHSSPHVKNTGFWEINSASCIDYAQQQRLVDVVDNRDGTLSIFAIVLDHAGPASTNGSGYSVERMASISRELAANQWFDDPLAKLGKAEDRNTELLLSAPFDLATVEDDELAMEALAHRTRLLIPRRRELVRA